MKVKLLSLNAVDSIALVIFSASPIFGGIMLVLRQIVTLTKKNLRLEVSRHVLSTTFRALLLPVAFVIFLGYAQNLVIAPASCGVGVATPVFSLLDAMNSHGVPSKLVMVNNNLIEGDIDHVIETITRPIKDAGKEVVILSQESQLSSTCRQTIRQVSDCYAAAVFHPSPSEGSGSTWNYSIRIDAARGRRIDVHSSLNDVQLYPIPLQHAIDWTIASLNESVSQEQLPETVLQYPYTDETETQRREGVRTRFQNTIRSALAVAFFLGQVGVIFHLVGFMTYERERGISQLIEAMMPNRKRWQPQFARLLSYHLSFVLIYLPGWAIIAVALKYIVFVQTNLPVLLGFYILSGLALTSSAIFGAAFFRRTQFSAITVTGVSLILAILGMVFGGRGNWIVGLLSLFFPPITIINFIDESTYWETERRSIDLYLGAPGRNSRLPGLLYWDCLVLQILVFPILATFIERCFYSASSRHRSITRTGKTSTHPIRLKKMSKVYQPHWYYRLLSMVFRLDKSPVRAVEGLTSNIGRGQITVLLGPNGSGKTTTLRCIAGIENPTGGFVEIDGVGGLGICPQENVFWDLLTVEEHVQIFNALKRIVGRDPIHAVHDLIRSCDLETKTHALAKTLSGGQKRKLQLAMMFTAGSQICCVDEVSSGLDPQSRRKIWEILLAKRGERTIVLTTHFLDEVDYLADRVIVISQGSIRAEGSTVDLKQRWGGGYSVQMTQAPGRGRVELGDMSDTPSGQEVVSVERSSDVTNIVDELEARGITDYRINGPSIETVFFNILGEPLSSGDIAQDNDLDLQLAQPGGLLQFIGVMFAKRLIIVRRNLVPHLLALVVAPLVAGAASIFLNNYNGLQCGSNLPLTNPITYTSSSLHALDFVIGPSSQISSSVLQRLASLTGAGAALDLTTSTQSLHLVDSLEDFNNFVGNSYANVTPGGVFLGSNASPPTFAYHANGPLYHAIFTQNVLNTLITNVSTNAQFSEFASASQPGIGNTMQFILYFGLAMTTYAAVFALYPTTERQQNIRALHYSNGLRALPLWMAYTMFDFCFVVIASVIVIVILSVVFHAWFALSYLFVVLTLFGLCSLLIAFVVSLFAKSQLAAFAFSAGGQAIMFMIYIVAYLSILTNSSSAHVDSSVNLAYYLLAIIMPPSSLARALLISLNTFSISCDGSKLTSYPGDIKAYGGPILYLLIQSFVLFGFLVWWDSGPKLVGFRGRAHFQHHEEAELADTDILSEVERVSNSEDGLRVLHASKVFGRTRVVDDITFGVAKNEVFTLLGPNGAGKTTLMALIRGELTLSEQRGEVLVQGIPLSKNLASLRAHLGFCPQFDAIDTMTVTEHLQLYAKIKGVRNTNANVHQILQLMGLVPYANRLGAQLSGGYKRRLSLGIALIGNPKVLLLDEPSSGLDAVAKRAIWQTIKAASRGRSIVLTTHSMEEAEALADRAGIMERRMLALGTISHLRRRYGDSYTIHLVCRTAPHTPDEEMERLRRWVVENIEDASLEEKSLHGQLKFSVPASKDVNRMPRILAQFEQRRPTSQETGVVGPEDDDDIRPAISPSRPRGRGGTVRTIFATLETNREWLDLEYYSVSPSALEEVFFNVVGSHSSTEELLPGRWWWRWRRRN